MTFLAGRRPRPWDIPEGGRVAFEADGYHLGNGNPSLEVAVARAATRPTESDVRNLWKRRRGNTPSPLLLVVLYPSGTATLASVCGPTGEEPPVYSDRDPGQVERLATAALDESDRHTASRLLASMLPEQGEGLRNVGMFAEHHLRDRVPQRSDWNDLNGRGREVLGLRGQDLVRALGFTIDAQGSANVLRRGDQAAALAVFLDESEAPDAAAARFNGVTPASWGLARARGDNLPFVVLTRRDEIRVYATSENAGVGRKGGTETFVAVNLALLPDDQAAYLPLLFGADALTSGGTFQTLLNDSQDYSIALGERLRQRVYEQTVPYLAQAIGNHHQEAGGALDEETLHDLYEQALLVLFRLLFVAYAEDRDLLPLHRNGLYRQRSLKHMAREIAEMLNDHGELRFDADATDRWESVRALWNAVDAGNREWGVPKYNGGLFSNDPSVKAAGGALASLTLTNDEFGSALAGLLVERDGNGIWGPVDFASLKVREFGTIYEGLLESELSVAQSDLTIDAEGTYQPARGADEVIVCEGEVYLHNRSGSRKATGSYFTKPFAVTHLLDHALEPALDAHVRRLTALVEAGDEDKAAEAFFDFRVVDLAMGSGHFLVAALDRVEARLSQFLADQPIPGVLDELDRLRDAAVENLGEQQPAEGIDTNSLLRRQVARRCIYGIDINDIAVELARLALWVHTFVEGLPLTSLNHGLVHGNSLTGIGTVEEALDVLEPGRKTGTTSFFDFAIQDAIAAAQKALARFAATSEANLAEIRQARKAHQEARAAADPVAHLFDLAVAVRLGDVDLPHTTSPDELLHHPSTARGAEIANGLDALHLPVAFPEVFNRERPGFDCILGNPPWEEATLEAPAFWTRHVPGFRSLSPSDQQEAIDAAVAAQPALATALASELTGLERLRLALVRGPFPGMGSADPDLYKAFCWRFLSLTREGGFVGVVLPRSALSAAGSEPWRRGVLTEGHFSRVTTLKNELGWVFPDVASQYTVALTVLAKTPSELGVRFAGPYSSLSEFERSNGELVEVSTEEFDTWTSNLAFPSIPRADALSVFRRLRQSPRLDDAEALGFVVRPATEFHATKDKPLMTFDAQAPDGFWPVYKGASFNRWEPDTGKYYAWARSDTTTNELLARRVRSAKRATSPLRGAPDEYLLDDSTIPALNPRIVFRDIARAWDPVSLICTLAPPEVFLTNKAPYLVMWDGNETDVAFLLGVLSSSAADWYIKRVLELGLNFHIFNGTPVPALAEQETKLTIARLAAERISRTDPRLASFGPDRPQWQDRSTEDLEALLDAAVMHAYGLTSAQVKTLLDTLPGKAPVNHQALMSAYEELA